MATMPSLVSRDAWVDLDEELGADGADIDDLPDTTEGRDQANRILRTYHRVLTKREEIALIAARERDRIAEWEREQTAALDGYVSHLTYLLENHARATFERTRTKTISLPNGQLTLRNPVPHIEVTDDEELWAWAKEAALEERLFTHKWAASKQALRDMCKPAAWAASEDSSDLVAALTIEGEEVPGAVAVKAAYETFSVRLP